MGHTLITELCEAWIKPGHGRTVQFSLSGEKAYETSEHVAVEVLQWFKFRFFDAWQAMGAKGSAFDGTGLT